KEGHLMGRTRRTFTAEEKLKVVMAVIQDGKAVSDVAKENNIHPNMILNWKKEFLENAAMIFNRTRPDITEKAQQKKIDELEAKLQKKDEVIAEIAEENMLLKKTFGGRS
ncbi:MAG: transposase, partial [Treponema sp.]|nr:transposase [Treponema sp.]